ncbi:hypothetical protein BJ986_002123 [Phycicoccus badiiscoriae]|uniref:Glycosyltransferase n=1 Tax=Pedococcus badiiscoriae TaxID=642776 RepID=A0A852WQP6_9MICO|nr:hypothetical protein [Pedococcus badiiscoriae]NYG07636.1 hypothetical protein [Pedococcus badiiscoriae]
MNVVLLSAGPPLRAGQIEEARHQLRADPDARLTVVSWHRPGRPLPVDQHILVRAIGGGRTLPVVDAAIPVAPSELDPDGSTGLALGPGGPEEEPETAFADEAAEPAEPSTPPARASKFTRAGVTHALRWRSNRVRRAVRSRTNRLSTTLKGQPVVGRVVGSAKVRRVRKAAARGTLASRYAAACLASRHVDDVLRVADVVVALDTPTHRAAWLLARRHPAPDVVVGLAAASRCLQARVERLADQQS